jgi:hypothetical protein
MNCVCYDLFTAATLSCDKHSCLGGSHPLDECAKPYDGRMFTDKAQMHRWSKSCVHEMRLGCYPHNIPR